MTTIVRVIVIMSRAKENCLLILPQMTMLPKRTLLNQLPRVRAGRSRSAPSRAPQRAACGESAKEPVGIR